MAKMILLVSTAVGLSAIPIGVWFVNSIKDANSPVVDEKAIQLVMDKLQEAKQKITKDTNLGKCVSETFGNLDLVSDLLDPTKRSQLSAPPNKKGNNYFGSPSSNTQDIKGCFMVEWRKGKFKEGTTPEKWSGEITWFWAFTNGNKGFATFINAKPHLIKQKKLNLSGNIFFLEKVSDKWETKHLLSNRWGKEIGENEFGKLPKENDNGSVRLADQKHYWGFITGKEELERMCDLVELTDTNAPIVEKRWSWNYSKEQGKSKVYEWSQDMGWWDYLYGTRKFKLKNDLEKFTGTWTLVADDKSKG